MMTEPAIQTYDASDLTTALVLASGNSLSNPD